MVVNKTLYILEKTEEYGVTSIYLLGNKVIILPYLQSPKLIVRLNKGEIEQVYKLLKRNKHIIVSCSWIEYIKHDVEQTLTILNHEHNTPYHDRGWTYTTTKKHYNITVFLDNHDWEQFKEYHVPIQELHINELNKYAHKEE